MAWPAIAAAAAIPLAEAGANVWGAQYSAKQQRQEAQRNRDFQERMSSTAHQREVSDLRAAGLNPILSAGGGGSSTPGGSMAAQPDISDIGTKIGSSARDRLRIALETKANQQAIATGKAQEKLNLDSATRQQAEAALALENAKLTSAHTFSAQNMMRIEQENPNAIGWARTLMPLISQATGSARDISTIIRNLKGFDINMGDTQKHKFMKEYNQYGK